LKKREEFAVNLRKKKTGDIINAKRRRLIGVYNEDTSGPEHVQNNYRGYTPFEKNPEEFDRIMK
jgi:hypothetical protein